MDFAISVVVGVLSGLLASLAFWFLQFRVFRARISLAPTIAKYRLPGESAVRYQVRLKNIGHRDAIELQIRLSAALSGLVRHGSVESMKLAEWTPPLMRRGATFSYRISFKLMDDGSRRRWSKLFPDEVRRVIESDKPIDLEEFFQVADGVELRLHVFATDALSGARSLTTATYDLASIRVGRFRPGELTHTGAMVEAEHHDEPDQEHGETAGPELLPIARDPQSFEEIEKQSP